MLCLNFNLGSFFVNFVADVIVLQKRMLRTLVMYVAISYDDKQQMQIQPALKIDFNRG